MCRKKDSVRILIVEDIGETLEPLRKLFSESFSGAVIDTAKTVSQALETLDRAEESQVEYDVAIVDYKLPRDHGDNPEVNDAVADRIHRTMVGAMVVHITGYKDDPKVIAHIFGSENRSTLSPQVLLISKDDVEWATKLLSKVRQFIYGSPIQQKIDSIFGSRGLPQGKVVQHQTRRRSGRTGLSHDLAALTHEIVEHWDYLDEPLQHRIKRVFKVDTSQTPIRVGLL